MGAIDRRGLMALGGAVAIAGTATAAPPRRMLIVNALGGLGDPNAPDKGADSGAGIAGSDRDPLSPRILADAHASGVAAINCTLGYVAGPMEPFEYTVREIGVWDALVRRQSADLRRILTADDILRAREEKRVGIIYGFQNAAMMGREASRAQIFADLGVRVIQLTYNPANQLGGGAMAPGNPGLTPFGREVVAALNDARVMVDLSHSGEATCLDAARVSRAPVSINHTGCRALVDLPRNKSDAELRLVAERGGFVGIYFMPFLDRTSVATADDVVAHIDHAVRVCGEDHVGIGTDGGLTGVDDMPAYRARIRRQILDRRQAGVGAKGEKDDTLPMVADLQGPGQFRDLAVRLARRGYRERRIEKIMGLNFLRFARDVWGS